MRQFLAVIFLNVGMCIRTAQGAVPSDTDTEVWFKTLLPRPEGGWQRFEVGKGEAIYVSLHKALREKAIVTVWVRWEFMQLQTAEMNGGYLFGYLSAADHMEFDCAKIAERTLSSNFYANNNLTGDYRIEDRQTSWSPEVPGTIGDQLHSAACNSIKSHASNNSGR